MGGVAGMGVVKAFKGQSGISTGYPYLMESRFLPFADTVPVTIGAISSMSERHGRYGLCFTRCVFVWETEALQREGVLNFASIIPHGGFYYTPKTLRKYWRSGGLIYAFGEAKGQLEVPVSECKNSTDVAGTTDREDDAPRMCVICLSKNAAYASLPCGHLAYCGDCQGSARERNLTCPVCRCAVSDHIRIY